MLQVKRNLLTGNIRTKYILRPCSTEKDKLIQSDRLILTQANCVQIKLTLLGGDTLVSSRNLYD